MKDGESGNARDRGRCQVRRVRLATESCETGASGDLHVIKSEQKLLSLHDVHMALCGARIDSEEPIHVILAPGEEENAWYWHLDRALYGTKKASVLFQRCVVPVLKDEGFRRLGVARQAKEITPWRTARTFSIGCTQMLKAHFDITAEPRVGPSKLGRVRLGSFLTRQIQWLEMGFTWKGDPQHARKIAKTVLP